MTPALIRAGVVAERIAWVRDIETILSALAEWLRTHPEKLDKEI